VARWRADHPGGEGFELVAIEELERKLSRRLVPLSLRKLAP
jgi:hypothetical protein